jgi:hypothetical protein
MSTIRRMISSAITAMVAFYLVSAAPCAAAQLLGRVAVDGSPVADSTVTLWQADTDAPQRIGEAHSGADMGRDFQFGQLRFGDMPNTMEEEVLHRACLDDRFGQVAAHINAATAFAGEYKAGLMAGVQNTLNEAR